MYYVLIDSTGNQIEAYRDLDTARAAQKALVQQEPETADHVALLTYNEEGMPVGRAEMMLPRRLGQREQYIGETVSAALATDGSPAAWSVGTGFSREQSEQTQGDQLELAPA